MAMVNSIANLWFIMVARSLMKVAEWPLRRINGWRIKRKITDKAKKHGFQIKTWSLHTVLDDE